MTKQKFNVLVTRTDEYEIEIDTDVWTDHEIKDFAKSFFPTSGVQEYAEHIAGAVASRENAGQFFEGFGYLSIEKEIDDEMQLIYPGLKSEFTSGIHVTIIEEENIEYESIEIKTDEQTN